MGRHSQRPPRWRKPLIVGVLFGAGTMIYVVSHPAGDAAALPEQVAIGPVAATPLPELKDAPAVNMADAPLPELRDNTPTPAATPKNGRDGSPATMLIFTFPDGTAYGCPRAGGTAREPMYKCHAVKLVQR